MIQEEYFFYCPYCGSKISVLLEVSNQPQQYIEDCEVCCNPIEINYEVEDGEEITFFEANSIEQ